MSTSCRNCSMRSWRYCTFLHSVPCSPHPEPIHWDCASALRGSGSCVFVANCHPLCAYLRGGFPPGGNEERHGLKRPPYRVRLTGSLLNFTPVVMYHNGLCCSDLPAARWVCTSSPMTCRMFSAGTGFLAILKYRLYGAFGKHRSTSTTA